MPKCPIHVSKAQEWDDENNNSDVDDFDDESSLKYILMEIRAPTMAMKWRARLQRVRLSLKRPQAYC